MPPVAILCGGMATRLGSITAAVSKALVKLNGVPFLAHQFRLLRIRGVRRVVLCVGHHGEMIRDYVGDGSQFDLEAAFRSMAQIFWALPELSATPFRCWATGSSFCMAIPI